MPSHINNIQFKVLIWSSVQNKLTNEIYKRRFSCDFSVGRYFPNAPPCTRNNYCILHNEKSKNLERKFSADRITYFLPLNDNPLIRRNRGHPNKGSDSEKAQHVNLEKEFAPIKWRVWRKKEEINRPTKKV